VSAASAPDTCRLLGAQPLWSLEDYVATGGGTGLARARALGPDGVVAELDDAGLRGRGGAAFPTARKWRSVMGAGGGTRYALANGAEGEPGTFKDRALIKTKIVDIDPAAGTVTYDERQDHKRPDWTYGP
jgi:NADH:ubiquinone oxidoreductase subunit F (NADH-binding)